MSSVSAMKREPLTATQVAAKLGITPARVSQILLSGRMLGHKDRWGYWAIEPEEFERFRKLPQRKRGPKGPWKYKK